MSAARSPLNEPLLASQSLSTLSSALSRLAHISQLWLAAMFSFAPSADVYRAGAEGRRAVVSATLDDVADVAQAWGGQRWRERQPELDAVAHGRLLRPDVAARPADAGRGVLRPQAEQQLGAAGWTLPASAPRRLALLLLQSLLPALHSAARQRGRGGALLQCADWLLPQLRRLHLALFFLAAGGGFLSLAQRLSGLRHLSVRAVDGPRPPYSALGLLLLLQIAVTAAAAASRRLQRLSSARGRAASASAPPSLTDSDSDSAFASPAAADDRDDEDDDGGDSLSGARHQCVLHLGALRDATATECGHVFCWLCIADCERQRERDSGATGGQRDRQREAAGAGAGSASQCPVCRSPTQLHNLLRLQHY